MERCTNDAKFITIDDRIMGINLGYDFTTEHESGIQELRDSFGIKRNKPGFEGLVNTISPKGLQLYNEDINGDVALVYLPDLKFKLPPGYDITERLRGIIKNKLYTYKKGEIASAWSERDFGVKVPKENGYALENLFRAFNAKLGIIMLGGRSTFLANSGLVIMDYSLIPKEVEEEYKAKDIAARAEQTMYRKLEQESGVYVLLKEAGKRWLALSIKHLDEKGEPLWWLNPDDQRNHQRGWYHTEDLRLWAEDKGPVMEMRK